MNKEEHGRRLKVAMAMRGFGRQVVADFVGVKPRTVTNWTTGATAPDAGDMEMLRQLLGDYDAAGDPVVLAIRASELTTDRQYEVLGAYERALRNQRIEEERGAAG